MGMDAVVRIWVGFRREDYDPTEEDIDKLHPDLKSLFANYDEDEHVDEIALTDDLEFALFNVSEEFAGGGVEVFYHDWDYGNVAFDTAALADKINAVLPLVQAKFEEWGFKAPVGVWIQTNYW